MQPPLIAVVNHDRAFLDLMSTLLADEGFRIVVQHGSEEAYQTVRREQPHLVILDAQLDGPDSGWRILDMIRLDPVTTHIPVIVCSTDPRLLQAKADLLRRKRCDMLEKPFDLDDLLAKIRNNLAP